MTKPGPWGQRGRATLDCVRRLLSDEGGATAIEYAMIAGLIFVAILGSVRVFGERMTTIYERISTNVGASFN